MSDEEMLRFVNLLVLELENGDISLPSLPDVVTKIRKMLESESCNVERVGQAVSVDPVLVARLFVFANSALYNRANIQIESLDGAISRLGFEVVRNTAMSLAMQQLFSAGKDKKLAVHLRKIWAHGMRLSCMAHSIASRRDSLNPETAFICGLMNEVGKLYILTKASDFPALLGDEPSIKRVMDDWNPQISKCIIEAWGFPAEVAVSADPATCYDEDPGAAATYADVMVVAKLFADNTEEKLSEHFDSDPSCMRLGIDEPAAAEVMLAYRDKLKAMQQSLS